MAKYNTCQVCGQKEIPFFVVDDDILEAIKNATKFKPVFGPT